MDTVKLNPDMPEENKCPRCGTPLPAGALAGLCPVCLLVQGAEEDSATEGRQPAFVPPSIPELAPLFPQLEILELIGRGGMGAVYKARQKQLDRIVALKILPPGIGDDPAFAERFAREAKALAKLNHPGIVTLYEFGQVQNADGARLWSQLQPQHTAPTGSVENVATAAAGASHTAALLYFFLMEFVDGVNLRQLLHNGRVSPREALAIVPQICDALQFAHDQGIVHRDIKPENILLDRRGRVKVADFGLAKIVGVELLTRPLDTLSPSDGERAGVRGESALTDAGKIMGTPNYMAPEQTEHPAEVDHRADIYALGVVFYQMLTGELPGKPLQPPSNKVHIDVRLDEVVLRALEKKPELRYQQASGLKTAVETISTGAPPDPMAASTSKQPRRICSRQVLIAVAAGVLVGLVTLLVIASVTFLMPDSFRATTRLTVDRLAPAGLNQPQPQSSRYDPYFIQTEFENIQSELVLNQVIEKLDLNARWSRRYADGEKLTTAATTSLLKQRLALRPVRNTSLIEISVFSENPSETAELANAIADSYVEFRQKQLRAYLESAKSMSPAELVVLGEPQLKQVQIVDRAETPVRPVRPNRTVNLFIGAVIGTVLGLVVSVATLLGLYFLGKGRQDGEQGSPSLLASAAAPGRKPWFAFCVALTYAGTVLLATLCELLLNYVLGSWIILMLLLLAGATAVLTFLLQRFANSELQRMAFKTVAMLAFLTALPIIGFAAFFLFALVQENFGWNPARDEAVIVPMIWLGAFMLPVCGLRLLRAGMKSPSPELLPTTRGGWGLRLAVGLTVVAVLTGLFLVGVAVLSYVRLRQSPASLQTATLPDGVHDDTRASASQLSFGPVIERVVTFGEVGADGLIFVNLEKGEVLPPPFHLTEKPFDSGLFERNARIEEWIAGSGVDLALQLREINWAFTPLGTRLMFGGKETTSETFLEEITPAAAESILTNPKARGDYIASLGGGVSAYPASMNYLFKTRAGIVGLLRLVGFTNEVNGVKIRYRLAQESANSSTAASALAPVRSAELEFRLVAAEGDTRTPADELADPNDRTGQQKLRVLKEVLLDSSAVASASRETNESSGLQTINITLKETAAQKFADITAANISRRLAIVWRGRVLSAPVIRTPINGPAISVTGNLSDSETLVLLDLLNYGAGADAAKLRKAELTVLRARLQEFRSRFTDSHPQVTRLLEEIKMLETK